MTRIIAPLVLLAGLALAAPGCDDGGDTTPATDTTSGDTTTDTTADTTPTVSYATQVQPIFAGKCTPCHTGGSSGGHDIGTTYEDANQSASACAGLTVGECTIVRIQAGEMPQGAGCSGDPATDAGNAACLTAAEQASIQAWIDGGLAP